MTFSKDLPVEDDDITEASVAETTVDNADMNSTVALALVNSTLSSDDGTTPVNVSLSRRRREVSGGDTARGGEPGRALTEDWWVECRDFSDPDGHRIDKYSFYRKC